jgi:hypothetical protein
LARVFGSVLDPLPSVVVVDETVPTPLTSMVALVAGGAAHE